MLFHSSLRRELARSFGATLVVLATVVMTMTLIRTLNQAARGIVNPQEVVMVMGYLVLGSMPLILSLSLFIAIVVTLSRMYRDSEMVIWFTSGRGLAGFLSPLLRFSWPVLAVVFLLAVIVWPWTNQNAQDLRERYGKRTDIERIAPGQFQESASGSRVFFLDKDTPDNRSGRNVFIASTERGRESVTSAQSGRIEWIDGKQVLILERGHRVETRGPGSETRVSDFEEYSAEVGGTGFSPSNQVPARQRSTLSLLAEPGALSLGELSWRAGMVLAAINFVVIALAVAGANPRLGRSGNLMFALFAFIVYYNLLNLGQTWISNGRFGIAGFMLSLHGGALLLALLWLLRRHRGFSLRLWLRPLARRLAALRARASA